METGIISRIGKESSGESWMENIERLTGEFERALLKINRIKAAEIFKECYAAENGFNLVETISIQALERIGQGWENGSVSLAQVYMSGVICEELVNQYLPDTGGQRDDCPPMAIAVLLDHHALGKRIVTSVLRASGYPVLDFGQGIGIAELVQKTIENKVEILLISTLMLPSALKVKTVKAKLAAAGWPVKIIVGGAPFRLDSSLWQRVDADADGKNAANIVRTIQSLGKGGDA